MLIPGHSSVLVELPDDLILIDVATVDCIDGVLSLSVPLETTQTVRNGVRYKFSRFENEPEDYHFPPDFAQKVTEIDPEFQNLKYFSIALMKEDALRDDNYNLVNPQTLHWIPRFLFKFPLRANTIHQPQVKLSEVIQFPKTLDPKLVMLIIETTTVGDPRSFHFKQWVGMKYSKDGLTKKIVAGFRYIVVKRPFSDREMKRYEPQDRETVDLEKIPLQEIFNHLENDIGIVLSDEAKKNLKVKENYLMPSVEHVWAY